MSDREIAFLNALVVSIVIYAFCLVVAGFGALLGLL